MKGLSPFSKRVNTGQYLLHRRHIRLRDARLIDMAVKLATKATVDADVGVNYSKTASWKRQEYLKHRPLFKLALNVVDYSALFDLFMRRDFKSIHRCITRNFRSSPPVGKRLKLSHLTELNDNYLSPKTTTMGKKESTTQRSRIMFHTEDLAEFVEKILEVLGVVSGDVKQMARTLANNGEVGLKFFVELCRGKGKIAGDAVNNSFNAHTHENCDNNVIGGKDDCVLLQRRTVETLLQYASDFDIAFPRGT